MPAGSMLKNIDSVVLMTDERTFLSQQRTVFYKIFLLLACS
jgi:hypothetical protein